MSAAGWEELGWIDVQTAGVAFCRDGSSPSERHRGALFFLEDGVAYQATMADCPLPVEVRRNDEGVIIAARMCFTDDVDEIEGNWEEAGILVLAGGRCVACDPDCEGAGFHLDFDVSPGSYVVNVFRHTDPDGRLDVLGLNVTLKGIVQ